MHCLASSCFLSPVKSEDEYVDGLNFIHALLGSS